MPEVRQGENVSIQISVIHRARRYIHVFLDRERYIQDPTSVCVLVQRNTDTRSRRWHKDGKA